MPVRFYQAVGRRKTATARVRLWSGEGKVTINGRIVADPDYLIIKPLQLVDEPKKYDVTAQVRGGGVHAQAQAIQLGIARALNLVSPTYRMTLKKAGLLTRDPRSKERKKPGLKRARRAPQWQKR